MLKNSLGLLISLIVLTYKSVNRNDWEFTNRTISLIMLAGVDLVLHL
nr:hypothetical protein [Mycoplasmopsis bovis]